MTKMSDLPIDMVFLIIDESDSFRDIISMGLKSLGFKNIIKSPTSHLAYGNLITRKIDFVISELNLDAMSGIDLLKEIREDRKIGLMPFLMMSTEITKDQIAMLAEYEIDGFIKKPFTFQMLVEKIPVCLNHYNDPTNKEYFFSQAKKLLAQKNYQQAFNTYETLLNSYPQSARACVGLSHCYRGFNDFERAEYFCRKAIDNNKLYVQGFDEMGKICIDRNMIDQAIYFFKRAVFLSPKNPVRYESITNTLIEKQRFKEAEEFLEDASLVGIDYQSIYEQYARALFYQRKLEKAVMYFDKALENSENRRSLLNLMGICYKDLNRYDEAIKYYDIAIHEFPTDTKVLFNKALCYLEMNDLKSAMKICEDIVKIEPTHEKASRKIKEIEAKMKN
ncbi:tetratricopeptide repeat protein [Fluviispira multicolorata]|uniref:Tetratricopeptide repeat protein n=1 Tax=Fluviispira multicolorata TaxID=2654512 RepID=A0A833JBQ4_9BACT|nr:tetratricopeptide repeat protein [Fluviispira multicolorata]KAB8029083.1 tetratricopeptide repeat protein [Fluviispira multicolorata]